MPERVIPLVDARVAALPLPAGPAVTEVGRVTDTLGRPLRDLRISVTEQPRRPGRCGFPAHE
ncbi:MAG: hypothetical protein IPJ36_06055 [Simplicispira sp.]|nr:hypothetical protein [Simplicispira sp.]